MTSLLSLARRLEVGDSVVWVGEYALPHAGNKAHPKTVTRIDQREDWIRVYGEGIQGGQHYFQVDHEEESEAIFLDPETGEESNGRVVLARLVTAEGPVAIENEVD